MAGKNKPYLRLMRQQELDEINKKAMAGRRNKIEGIAIKIIVIFLVLLCVYMIFASQTYTRVIRGTKYEEKTSDTNHYEEFGRGIIRYSRDGVVFLNRRNEEQWIHPCQIKQPIIDINENCFAVADCGGNSIIVFTEKGVKGEIKTNLPIEKISVSDQGVVAAILKNEDSPTIILYDATGNILVEHQISIGRLGYPIGLEISDDGTRLAVSHLVITDGQKKSKLVFYDYGKSGKSKADNVVRKDTYENDIFPEIFFMNGNTAIVVGGSSLIVYDTKGVPEKKKEISLNGEIKNVVHTKDYVGLIMLNGSKSGYEARVYNREGTEVMNKEFIGEYSNVKMSDDELIMTSGKSCLIIRRNGKIRFQGEMPDDILEVIPVFGPNHYLVMSKNELSSVYLIK